MVMVPYRFRTAAKPDFAKALIKMLVYGIVFFCAGTAMERADNAYPWAAVMIWAGAMALDGLLVIADQKVAATDWKYVDLVVAHQYPVPLGFFGLTAVSVAALLWLCLGWIVK